MIAAAVAGLRARALRSVLSALGIAIGIAAMVAVLGVSASSRADLLAELDALGTNLLRVAPGQTFLGEEAELPASARRMMRRVPGVTDTAALIQTDATVRRTAYIPEAETGGIGVVAAEPEVAITVGARMRSGRFLDAALGRYPAVVLGAVAAERLGITRPGTQVWLGGRWFTVAGILEPVLLAPGLDEAALIGFAAARRLFDAGREPSTVYVRTRPDAVADARALLGAAANPERPEEVEVSRPSDALEARAVADAAFATLLLALGGVALLVGGVGIANVMVVAVLERRSEVGLRRALGARRGDVGRQFLAESVLLSALGGVGGVLLGSGVTAAYAASQDWRVALPVSALLGGVAAAIVIGAVAGLYPALRAARLAPAEALRLGA